MVGFTKKNGCLNANVNCPIIAIKDISRRKNTFENNTINKDMIEKINKIKSTNKGKINKNENKEENTTGKKVKKTRKDLL